MANRGDINKLCSNLTQMGVEIKPDELQNLSRTTALRVMTDFTVAVFLASPESLNQQLAILLQSHNVNSAATPFITNRCILWSEALTLLSKGSSIAFDFVDLLKPEAKKFNQMLQQMLKYLFYSAKVYDAVSEECNALEDVAEEIEKQRVLLDLDKEELRIIDQKIAHLNEAKIAEEFSQAVAQRDVTLEEANKIKSEYGDLKSTWEKEQAELFDDEEQLSTTQQELLELNDLVVSDPDSQVAMLEQLRKDSTTKAALLASKEKQLNEVNTLAKLLDDEKQRVLKILAAAKNMSAATEGFHQNTKILERKIEDSQKSIVDLQSERDCLQATVESRNQQVKTMNDEERLRSDTIQALEQEDCVKKELLANTERLKSPLVSDLNRMKQELSESVAQTDEFDAAALDRTRQKHDDLKERWKNHVEEVRLFEAECLKTEKRQREAHQKLSILLEELKTLDLEEDLEQNSKHCTYMHC